MPNKIQKAKVQRQSLFEHVPLEHTPDDKDIRNSLSFDVDKKKDGDVVHKMRLAMVGLELSIKDIRRWLRDLTSHINARPEDTVDDAVGGDHVITLADIYEGYVVMSNRMDEVEFKLAEYCKKLDDALAEE